MMKSLLGLLVAGAAVAFLASAGADDKKDAKKTLEGKMVCTKCKLSETPDCGNALIVKEGDKEVTYYIKDKGKKETYHKCSGEQACKVTGKITEKDGKKYIEDAKVEKVK
ncbi:MAG TPA: hypothetical protein VGJ05_01605 [Fimbriiglobus sp.]|jgi:hypothetical protein